MSSNVPLNSLLRHTQPLHDELARIGGEVIRSGYYVLGPHVKAFEQAFARYCGVSECVGVANGTDALELSLRGVGVSSGDRVAVIANAAMYSTSAVLAIGAQPAFVDIGEDANMDPAALSAVLEGGDIRAIVATHLYGRLAQMDAIMALAQPHGIPVVEDCAQAHGARDAEGRAAGSLGTIASFSFYPTKNLGALGDGGAVVTDDATLAARVRQLRQYGWGAKYTNEVQGGRNSRLDELQAAMLGVMLPHLDAWNARRQQIANHYSANLHNPAIIAPPAAGDEYVGHLYVVRSERRDALRKHLSAAGVDTDVHYPLPDHRQPCFSGRFDHVRLPRTEAFASTVLSLPCFPELTDSEVERVVEACNRF